MSPFSGGERLPVREGLRQVPLFADDVIRGRATLELDHHRAVIDTQHLAHDLATHAHGQEQRAQDFGFHLEIRDVREDAQPAFGNLADLVLVALDRERCAARDRVGQAEILAPARQLGYAVGGSHGETIRANPEGSRWKSSHLRKVEMRTTSNNGAVRTPDGPLTLLIWLGTRVPAYQ